MTSLALQQAIDALQQASQAMAEHLYAASAAASGEDRTGGPGPGPERRVEQADDVIDVELRKEEITTPGRPDVLDHAR